MSSKELMQRLTTEQRQQLIDCLVANLSGNLDKLIAAVKRMNPETQDAVLSILQAVYDENGLEYPDSSVI